MGGRIAKAFMRFIAPVLIVTVMGSSSLVAGAGEINSIDSDVDIINAGMADGDEISDAADNNAEDSDSLGMDVCFFIRLDEGRTTIPDEPMNHSMLLYSDAIRINDAVSDSDFVYSDSITEELTADGFTAQNAVTDKLSAYPTVSQIQEVYSTFDPDTQYVIWYVIKRAGTLYPNSDVFIHVDGMILDKPEPVEEPSTGENAPGEEISEGGDTPGEEVPGEVISEGGDAPGEEPGKEEPGKEISEGSDEEPGKEISEGSEEKPGKEISEGSEEKPGKEKSEGEDKKPEDEGVVSSELSFEVFSTNTQPQFEYDGEEHLIGGYVIRVTDSAEGNVSEYVYGPYGDFLGVTVKSVGFLEGVKVDGTVFTHKGLDYNVNVDSAFLLVRNPGTYEIPLLFKGMVMSAADIIIKDEKGKIVDTAKLNISTPASSESITKRKLTIEAGSTIQNDTGSTLTNDNVKITSGSLLPGHQLVTSIVGSQTGPGESVNEISSYDILDADGKSCKEMYDVTSNKGWLVVVGQKENASGAGSGQASSGSQQVSSEGGTQVAKVWNDNTSVVMVRDQSILGATRDDEGQSGIVQGNIEEGGKDSSSNSSGKPAVLGARTSNTTDLTMPIEIRVSCIVLCLMALMIINIKRSKKL